tara:strand:+ start:846 stop:1136 length:291 start_codon:yes stop_codon:yes gene_type:complete
MSDSIKKYFENENKKDYKDWLEYQWTKNTTADIKTDSVVESVISRFKERSAVGIDKYNTTLEDSTESFKAFLNHAQEEAMDFCLYLEKLKQMNNDR